MSNVLHVCTHTRKSILLGMDRVKREISLFWGYRWGDSDTQSEKDHTKSGFVEDFQEGRKGVSDQQCSHEKVNAALERTSEVVGARGRLSLSENILASSSKEASFRCC